MPTTAAALVAGLTLTLSACTGTGAEPSTSSASASGVRALALTGGGFRAHTGHSAVLLSALSQSGNDLGSVLGPTNTISANSAASWLLTQLSYSSAFDEMFSAPDAAANWDTSGYLGQIKSRYGPKADSGCSKTLAPICDAAPELEPYLTMVSVAGGQTSSWQDTMTGLLFDPYDMTTELEGVTLASPRQPWSQGKDLLWATGVVTDQAVITSDGDQISFYTVDDQTEVVTTPVSLVSAQDGSPSGFLSGNPTLSFGPDVIAPGKNLAHLSAPSEISASEMGVIDAASVSSPAAALLSSSAYTSEIAGKSGPEFAAEVANLSPPFELNTMQYAGDTIAPGSPQELTSSPILRFADGGEGDNTSMAHLMRHLQDTSGGQDFRIFLIAHTQGKAIPDYDGWGSDVARVFGYQTQGGITKQCEGKQDCIPVTQSQVFDRSALKKPSEAWSYKREGVDMKFACLNVQTVDNSALGITPGAQGQVCVLQTLSDLGLVPASEAQFDKYQQFLEAIVSGIADHGGWPMIQKALGLP